MSSLKAYIVYGCMLLILNNLKCDEDHSFHCSFSHQDKTEESNSFLQFLQFSTIWSDSLRTKNTHHISAFDLVEDFDVNINGLSAQIELFTYFSKTGIAIFFKRNIVPWKYQKSKRTTFKIEQYWPKRPKYQHPSIH